MGGFARITFVFCHLIYKMVKDDFMYSIFSCFKLEVGIRDTKRLEISSRNSAQNLHVVRSSLGEKQ